MLNFFRKKAQVIGFSIVLFFTLTMLSGALFLRGALGSKTARDEARPSDLSNELALVGQMPISKQKYFQILSGSLNQIRASSQEMSPELIEIIKYSAFSQALQYSVLLGGAKSQKVKVAKQDLNKAIDAVLIQYDLKNKKALKELLKNQKYPYELFINELKNNISVDKFSHLLQEKVIITDKDLENRYLKIKAQHILFKNDEQNMASDMGNEALKNKAQAVYDKIMAGLDFSKAAKEFSKDLGTAKNGGKLGYLQVGDTVKEFEDVLFALDKGEVSKPIRSPFGFHIIKVLDIQKLPKPKDLDKEKEKEEILAAEKNRAISAYIQNVIEINKLTILEPSLRAYDAKIKGDYDKAIAAYQALASRETANPYPHYMLAKVYLMLDDAKNCKQELLKAQIKGEMMPQLNFADIYFLLADLHAEELYQTKALKRKVLSRIKQKERKEAKKIKADDKIPMPILNNIILEEIGKGYLEKTLPKDLIAYYDKAFELSKNNIYALHQLKTKYDKLHAKKKIKEIEQTIKVLEELRASANAQAAKQEKS
jgi:parvulin-like peptidyl-prolyl isomerase